MSFQIPMINYLIENISLNSQKMNKFKFNLLQFEMVNESIIQDFIPKITSFFNR